MMLFGPRNSKTNNSPNTIPTVNDQVRSGRVGGCIRGEIDVCGLELGGIAVASHGDHAAPQLLCLFVNEVGQASVNVA